MMICLSATLFADDIKRSDSYNYTRGIEAIGNNNVEEALQYLNKEIEEHPENGYAYSWFFINHDQKKVTYKVKNNKTKDYGKFK